MRDAKNENNSATQKSKYASGQALIGKDKGGKVAFANSKNDALFVKWMCFVHSPRFLVVAIITSIVMAGALYGYVGVLESAVEKMLAGVQVYAMYFITGATSALVLYGLLNVFGIWMHFSDAFMISRRRSWTPGLTLIIVTNRIMLGLVIAAFVVMLPLFVEWLPYDAANDLFLQLTYVGLILVGVWCAVLMVNAQKMRQMLSLLSSSQNLGKLLASAQELGSSHMQKKKKFGGVDLLAHTVMLILAVCVLYPMLNVLATSLSGSAAVLSGNITIFPVDFSWESYEFFLNDSKVLNAYKNSIIYTAIGVVYNVAMTALMAYPLSRMKLVGRSVFMKIVIFTMYFSGGTVPLFLLVDALGMYDSMWALFIPNSVWTMQMIICINGYQSIPDSLYEAAELDGAGELTMFTRIALPLSKATLATIAMQIFMSHWNSFYNPMLYLDNPDKFPLQVVLRSMLTENAEQFVGAGGVVGNVTPDGVKNAVIVLTMIPVLLIYPLAQKYFVKGALIGSVKG